MGPCVYNAIPIIAVRQIVCLLPGVKGKLQDLHAGISAVLQKLHHGICQEAQILRNDSLFSETILKHPEQLHPGTFLPMAVYGSLRPVGNAVIFIETAEMVNPHYIVQPEAVLQALAPPPETGLPVIIPFIERIPPQLPCGRERIRRAPGHSRRPGIRVKLEHLRTGPRIRRVKCHIDGNIPDKLDSVLIGISL